MSGFDEDILKKQVIEKWSQGGGNWPVKVMPANHPNANGDSVGGYFTQEKYVIGRSPQELEKILGLPEGRLKDGAVIKAFDRLPTADEFDLRSYSNRPDGAAPIPGNPYPPGLGAPQWQIRDNPDNTPMLIRAQETASLPGYEMVQLNVQDQLEQQGTNDQATLSNVDAQSLADADAQAAMQAQASSATPVSPANTILVSSGSSAYSDGASPIARVSRTGPNTSSTTDRINELLAGGNVRSSGRVDPISPIRPLSGDEGSPDWGQQYDNNEQSPNQNPSRQSRPGDQDEFEPRDPEQPEPGTVKEPDPYPGLPDLLPIKPDPEKTEPGRPPFDPNDSAQDLSASTLQADTTNQDQAAQQAAQDDAALQAEEDDAALQAAQDKANGEAQYQADTTAQDQADSSAQDQTDTTTQDQTDSSTQDQTDTTTQDQTDTTAQNQTDTTTQDQTDTTAQAQTDTSSQDQTTEPATQGGTSQQQVDSNLNEEAAPDSSQDQTNAAAQEQQVDSNPNEEAAPDSSSSENTSTQVDSNFSDEATLSEEPATSDTTSDNSSSTANVSSQPDMSESSSVQPEGCDD